MRRCISVLVFAALSISRPVDAASFNCRTVASPRDRLICAIPQLSEADSALEQAYRSDLAQLSEHGRRAMRAAERMWLRTVVDHCPTDVTPAQPFGSAEQCLNKAYSERLRFLKQAVVHFGSLTFFQVDECLIKQISGEKLVSTAFYPQLDQPSAPSWRAWNARQVMSPDAASGCDDQAGDTGKTEIVNFATSTIVNVTKSSYFYCPGTPHGHGSSEQSTTILLPSPHTLTPDDLFMSGSHWQEFLTAKVNEDVWSTARKAGLDPDSESLKDNRATATSPLAWTFSRDGLTIAFQPYELGEGRAFAPETHIGWAALRPYLKQGLGLPPT